MKKTVIKIAVSSDKCKDLHNILPVLIKESFSFNIGLGFLKNISFRVSYRDESNKVVYITLVSKLDGKLSNYEKVCNNILHKLSNRKIDHSSIESLHLHLYFE